jgi:hypothetical protein
MATFTAAEIAARKKAGTAVSDGLANPAVTPVSNPVPVKKPGS